MTREEAIERLKTEVKRIEEIMENGEVGCVDMDTWNEFAKKAEWRETLIELLSVPTPDPITGLTPCGCGGVTEQTDFHDGFFPHSKLWCLECGIEIIRAGNIIAEAHDEAKMAWNTAMGWKGGAE